MAVARNHAELIAGGHAVRLEAQLQDDATILASCAGSSFAGLGVERRAVAADRRNAVAAPAVRRRRRSPSNAGDDRLRHCRRAGRAGGADRAGRPADACRTRTIVALWRAPERLTDRLGMAAFRKRRLIDVLAFGETALIAARRSAGRAACRNSARAGVCATRIAPMPRPILETSGDGKRHAGAARTDGAAPSVPARRGAHADALLQAGRTRLRRHRLSVPRRSRQRRTDR